MIIMLVCKRRNKMLKINTLRCTSDSIRYDLDTPKFAWTGFPPKFSKCWNHIHFVRHLDVFRSKGGPVWDSDVFLKSVTYRPTLSKFRRGPVKKSTLYYENKMHTVGLTSNQNCMQTSRNSLALGEDPFFCTPNH